MLQLITEKSQCTVSANLYVLSFAVLRLKPFLFRWRHTLIFCLGIVFKTLKKLFQYQMVPNCHKELDAVNCIKIIEIIHIVGDYSRVPKSEPVRISDIHCIFYMN